MLNERCGGEEYKDCSNVDEEMGSIEMKVNPEKTRF